jgi:hypothetical protein
LVDILLLGAGLHGTYNDVKGISDI